MNTQLMRFHGEQTRLLTNGFQLYGRTQATTETGGVQYVSKVIRSTNETDFAKTSVARLRFIWSQIRSVHVCTTTELE